jgi:hypothetical protein
MRFVLADGSATGSLSYGELAGVPSRPLRGGMCSGPGHPTPFRAAARPGKLAGDPPLCSLDSSYRSTYVITVG